jgi:hypothetical protein
MIVTALSEPETRIFRALLQTRNAILLEDINKLSCLSHQIFINSVSILEECYIVFSVHNLLNVDLITQAFAC